MRLYICWRWQGAGYAKLLLFGPICNLTAIQAKNLRKSCKKELLISEIFSIDKKCVFQTQKITEVWVWSSCLVSIEKITSKISIFSSDLWEYWAYTGFLNHQCPFIGNCYENSVYVWWDTRVYATSSMKSGTFISVRGRSWCRILVQTFLVFFDSAANYQAEGGFHVSERPTAEKIFDIR